MIDVIHQIEAIQREVGPGRLPAGEGRTIRLQRTYDAPIDDVWAAFTEPERLSRWFLPVSGDFRLGGRYQFEGQAGGEILGRKIVEVITVNGVRVALEDGSWVLVRASSNKPEIVVVVESTRSEDDMRALFRQEVKPRLAKRPQRQRGAVATHHVSAGLNARQGRTDRDCGTWPERLVVSLGRNDDGANTRSER